MKQLNEFATLAEAKAYEHITYEVIKASEAKSFFIRKGVEDALNDNANNATLVNTGEANITVGSICRGALANTTGFNVDPSKEMGLSNRGMLSLLVGTGVITQQVMDEFIALGSTVTTPYASKTEYDFQSAKNTVAKTPVAVSRNGDFAVINTTTDVERHSPKIINDQGEEVARFYNVEAAGMYCAAIPANKRGGTFKCEDAYGAIA